MIWLSLALGLTTLVIAFAWFLYEADRPILRPPLVSADTPLPQGRILDVKEVGIELLIPYGTSARGVAEMIKEAGVDIHEGMFLLHARWLGAHRNLKAGVYLVEPGVTKKEFILRLAGRDPETAELRMIEGWTFEQVVGALRSHPFIRDDLPSPKNAKGWAEAIGLNYASPEGWFYPDAYFVKRGTSARAVLGRGVRLQRTLFEEAWEKRKADLPYQDPYQALIIASIVEKETQFPGDRERVAAVFTNRIRKGMPLQADPTVIYGMGKRYEGKITKADLRRDTPYNTYTRKKLPPTPISNPGPRAVQAVMNPAASNAIFFVARGDGSSQFSETLQEHNQAVNRFIRRLEK